MSEGNGRISIWDRWKPSYELLSTELQPVEWLVDGLLSAESLCRLEGWGGSWKTWILHNLCISLGIGGLFMGRFRCKKSRVMFVQTEENFREHHRKFTYSCSAAALTVDQIENMQVIHCIAPMKLSNKDQLDILKAEVREYEPQLIVVDSLRQSFVGDEDSSEFAQSIKDMVQEMQTVCPMAWLFVHHQRKMAGKAELDAPGQRGRGSGGLRDMLDHNYVVQADGNNLGLFTHEKCRVGPKSSPFSFTFDVRDGRAYLCYQGATNDVGKDVLDYLIAAQGRVKRQNVMLNFAGTFTEHNMKAALAGLVGREWVTQEKEGREVYYYLTTAQRERATGRPVIVPQREMPLDTPDGSNAWD